MDILKSAAFALCITCSPVSLAEIYTEAVNIGEIEVLGNGSFMLRSTHNLASGCYEGGRLFKVYVGSNPNEAAVKNMLSVALMAYSLGKPVDIYHNEDTNCFVKKLRIRR